MRRGQDSRTDPVSGHTDPVVNGSLSGSCVPDAFAATVSRRGVLGLAAGALVTGVLPLTGCGIRLEDDAPRPPLLGPSPAVLALRTELERCLAARSAAAQASDRRHRALAELHRRQVEVVRSRLTALGDSGAVPAAEGPRRSGSPSPSAPSPTGGDGALLNAEMAGLDSSGRDALAQVPGSDIVLVSSLHVQRAAVSTRLGGRPAAAPPPSVPDGDPARRLLDATRSAHYALQVATARSDGDRERRAGLDRLAARLRWLEGAVPDAVPPPAGYVLPFRVTDARTAARLGRGAAEALVQADLAALPDTDGGHEKVGTLLAWATEDELVRVAWGGDFVPFPGVSQT